MNMKNTHIYILFLLAGIMLASGCGGKKDEKSGAGGDVTDKQLTAFETEEKKLLGELEPLFMDFKKAKVGGTWQTDLSWDGTEAKAKAEFKKKYSDDPEGFSFLARLKGCKALLKNSNETGYLVLANFLKATQMQVTELKAELISLASPTTDEKKARKKCIDKEIEVHVNRIKILQKMMGMKPENGDKKT